VKNFIGESNMATMPKDERKLLEAQRVYDDSLDKYLKMMKELTAEIEEINDLIHGYTMRKTDEKYQLTTPQYNALKDRFNFWKSNLQNPDKVLDHINSNLRNKNKNKNKSSDTPSDLPKVAIFNPKAQN
jgi:chromosome segregation ATPase